MPKSSSAETSGKKSRDGFLRYIHIETDKQGPALCSLRTAKETKEGPLSLYLLNTQRIAK